MFQDNYITWNQKRIKAIIDFYGFQFMVNKTVLDLGCGHGDLGGALYRLGADITAVDARQEHLKMVQKKFPNIKTIKYDLDQAWPFQGKNFDLILDLGLICHLRDYEAHLKSVCSSTQHLVLETAVCNSTDDRLSHAMPENKGIYDLSFNATGCRPTAAAIERVLRDCGMDFKRMDHAKLNSGENVYDWYASNSGSTSIHNRRLWFCNKNSIHQEIYIPTTNTISIPPPITQIDSPIAPTYTPNKNIPIPISLQPTITQPIAAIAQPYFSGSKKFVIVIPSYNNSRYCIKNIESALNQNYNKFRIIFTDDCSNDGTFDKVQEYVNNSGKTNLVTLIKNNVRLGALANLYNMIHSSADDEIILTLDGDDWLNDNNVLNILNGVYTANDIWISYGQYKNSTDGRTGVAYKYADHVVNSNSFRRVPWGASHLRTFYAWLFKKIKKQDLMHNGNFFQITYDMALMYPMLEMAGQHSKFISDILYIYNLENPINDHKVNQKLQQEMDRKIRSMSIYPRVAAPPFEKKTNIGLLLIATNKYTRFLQGLITSADQFFMKDNKYNVTYYIFSDQNTVIQSNRKIVNIYIDHKPWPHSSGDRFKHFTNNANKFDEEDFLYYTDVDSKFVDNVGAEILGDLVGVQHCGYVNKEGPFETNVNSSAYVSPERRHIYYGGGTSGGKKENYLALAKSCYEATEKDFANNINTRWADESQINKFFAYTPPTVILSPSYHYPESNLDHYKSIWAPKTFKAKILLLDKNHSELR